MARATLLKWAVVVAGCFLLLSWSRGGRTQEAAIAADIRVPSLYGKNRCSPCHFLDKDREMRNDRYPPLCRGIEHAIWFQEDKHSNAFAVLKGERAQQMGKLLGGIDVIKDQRCLACHATTGDEKLRHATFQLDEGVSCVACHGAFERWIPVHGGDPEKWRTLSRRTKEQEFGMTDLWSPDRRMQVCASCHIGNGTDKFVTHEMYAAGHPPLPGFELATFSRQMPAHWQYLKDKPEQVQKLLGYDRRELEQPKLVMLGAFVALREEMKRLEEQAKRCALAKGTLDFANFDCYACHHDLKNPGWRQQRGYKGKPGRPQMRPWATSLAEAALGFLGEEKPAEKLTKQMQPLYDAFSVRPFGDCPRIALEAKSVADWTQSVLAKLATATYNQDAALRMLHILCSVAADKGEIRDYDSARQIAWAFQVIYSEVDPKPPQDQQIKETLARLDASLRLTLPAGKHELVKDLPVNLDRLNDYEPSSFRAAFERLAGSLPKKVKPDRSIPANE